MARKTTDDAVELAKSTWKARLGDFGQTVLRSHREALGLSQNRMAKRMGISQSQISRLEDGFEAPSDFPTAKVMAEQYELNKADTRRWYELLFGVAGSEVVFWDELLSRYDLTVHVSELETDEYWHIDPARRADAFTNAVHFINNLAPFEERRQRRLQQIKSLSTLEHKALGLSTYIDHETDHAAMLLLIWLKKNDSSRWHNLEQNLERLTDLAYRKAMQSGLDIDLVRVLNTLLCYAHRFGPSALADKAMRYALNLWAQVPGLTTAYVLRDVLHCDVFRSRPHEAERFRDFLREALQSEPGIQLRRDHVIPQLEILYFAPSVWAHQKRTLESQLFADPSKMTNAELSQVLKQTLAHLKGPDLPALSEANYMLVCTKLIQSHQTSLFGLLTPEIMGDIVGLVSSTTPAGFRGDPVLGRIRQEMITEFTQVERRWQNAQTAFAASPEH